MVLTIVKKSLLTFNGQKSLPLSFGAGGDTLPQAEEAVRLVRAAADHERLRKAHQKKVAALKARLRKLEEANG